MQWYRFTWHCADIPAMEQLASQLAAMSRVGDVLTLTGDLGAGKTTFARAFIAALPGGKGIEVTSPTFTLLQTYSLRDVEVWHYDLYRLEMEDELYELGFEDAFLQAITLIEWPERAGELLPQSHLALQIGFGKQESERDCVLHIPASLMDRFAGVGDHAAG